MDVWRSKKCCNSDSDSISISSSDDDTYCTTMSCSSQHSHYDNNNDDRTIVLRTMRSLETSVYKRPRAQSMPEIFRGAWRKQIVEWMYILIKYCKLKHEASAAAVYYLDAAVMCDSSSLVKTPRDYQLCAMTALHLALKVYDSPTVRVVKLSCLVKLGNGQFTEEDIIQKEYELVRALGWRINPPTANCFLQRYMELLTFLDVDNECQDGVDIDLSDSDSVQTSDNDNEDNDIDIEIDQLSPIERRRRDRLRKLEEVASEYIEVATARDRFLVVPPSVIAYASMLSAMELTSDNLRQKQNGYYDWSTFLRNMTGVAEMGDIYGDLSADTDGGNVSRSVCRTKMLLDRIVKGLALPPEEEDKAFFGTGMTKNTGVSGKTTNGNVNSNEKNGDRSNFAECTPSSTRISSSPASPTSSTLNIVA